MSPNPRPAQRPLIRALLLDISGTLHIGTTPTPNAVSALHHLRASGIPFRLCSNTSKESTASLVHRLRTVGFDIQPHSTGTYESKSQPIKWSLLSEVESGHSATSTPSVAPSSTSALIMDPDGGGDGVHRSRRPRQEVWTSVGAVARFLKDEGLEKPYFLLSPSAKEEVTSSNHLSKEEDDYSRKDYDSVVIGLAPDLFDYTHLNTAFWILKGENGHHVPQEINSADRSTPTRDPHRSEVSPVSHTRFSSKKKKAKLIATHKAKYFQTGSLSNGFLSLGPGPFVTALETATGVEAHIIGKPTQRFFEMVIKDIYDAGELFTTSGSDDDEAKTEGIAVIGDDVEADLGGGAVEMGLWRVLVKTGKYREGDEKRPGTVPPDEVFDSFAAFVENLLVEQRDVVARL